MEKGVVSRGEDVSVREELGIKIAGEIVLSESVGDAMKKWREIFGLTQKELSTSLTISTSVISDYENGRRKSPGVGMVKKIVEALLSEDEMRGARVIRAYERMAGNNINTSAILDIREFSVPMRCEDLAKIVKGDIIANSDLAKRKVYGYTVIDSLKAIIELSSEEFLKIYGLTSERALVFTKVSSGRSPFIAIRVSSLKPGLVVLHGLEEVDRLALKIAEKERIPVIISRQESSQELVRDLRRKTR